MLCMPVLWDLMGCLLGSSQRLCIWLFRHMVWPKSWYTCQDLATPTAMSYWTLLSDLAVSRVYFDFSISCLWRLWFGFVHCTRKSSNALGMGWSCGKFSVMTMKFFQTVLGMGGILMFWGRMKAAFWIISDALRVRKENWRCSSKAVLAISWLLMLRNNYVFSFHICLVHSFWSLLKCYWSRHVEIQIQLKSCLCSVSQWLSLFLKLLSENGVSVTSVLKLHRIVLFVM